MATVDFYIWKRPNKDGKYPISIRITINRKPSYIMTGQKLDSLEQWDPKKQRVKERSHDNATRLNNYLRNELAKANDKALELETKGSVSSKQVKKSVKPVEEKQITFLEIANQYLQEQKSCGNYDVFNTDTSRLKRFYEFANGGKLAFAEITPDFLHRFVVFLKQSKNRNYKKEATAKPLSDRTITNHLLIIRTLYNRAITAKHVSKDQYPFGEGGKVSIKFPKSSKIGLEEVEIKQLEALDLSQCSPFLNDARNIWLMSFYSAGMRITDCLLLKWTDFQNDRLFYTMSKNDEPCSIIVHPKALGIIDKYRNDNKTLDLVFPLLKHMNDLDNRFELRRQIAFAVNRLNKTMVKLMSMIGSTKNASQHKSRHAFAQRAEDKNIAPKVLQKMYRHSSILTTMGYQSNFSHQKEDEALEAVIGF